MAFLRLKDIGKIYVSEGNVTVGIRGVNLSFEKGEFVAVTGKSGSGKSTLLNVISGMDSFEEGELFIEGEPTSHFLQPDWEEYRSKYISFIFQDYNIIESFTVLQNVELALMHIEDKKARRKRALELIDRVGMTSHIKHKGSKLSGGQKQRTVIARALAKDSPIILADEPTGNLDSATSAEIIELLREVSKDKLLIVVTHNYDEVERFATRHIRFFDGAVEADTTVVTPCAVSESKEEIKEKKQSIKKVKEVKNGITLGRAMFTSKPKLSLFLCLLMILGTFGVFAMTSFCGEAFDIFDEYYMFNNIEGRLVVTHRSGQVVTEKELEDIISEYGGKGYVHYDLLLDQEDGQYFSFFDHEEGYTRSSRFECTFGETFGDDIIGKYPEKANEVFLYLPISYSTYFGKDSLITDKIEYRGLKYTISGVKYYYDNNIKGKCLFTEEGFETVTAVYYLMSRGNTNVTVTVTPKDGKDGMLSDSFQYYSFVPSFDVEEGKIYINDQGYRKYSENYKGEFQTNIRFMSSYYKYDYYLDRYDNYGKNEVFSKEFTEEIISDKTNSSFEYPEIYVSPSLLFDIANEVLSNSYRQGSVFFESDEKAESVAEKLNDKGYLAVPANTTYSPDESTTIDTVVTAIISGIVWVLSIVFLAFFINLCLSRTLGAIKNDMAIMRSMGIQVKVIRIGMYVRMLVSLIPAFIFVIGSAIYIFTSPKLNQYFVFLHAEHYLIIFVGVMLLTYRITKKQIKKLFDESVKKSLKGGAAE
ncbi:MAG: ABC transporter ATP-binding protein [Ruminococcaceae bacterium]|nr:ABC transporter ATP-binding protein [Oscillospiraceae bacterium]